MKLGMLSKLTIVNRFVLHTVHPNLTRLDIITPNTTIKMWKTAYFWNPVIICMPNFRLIGQL